VLVWERRERREPLENKQRSCENDVGVKGYRGIGYRGIGYRGIGYRGIGYRGIGYRGIGFRGIGYRGRAL
jgi:hypothetical protein